MADFQMDHVRISIRSMEAKKIMAAGITRANRYKDQYEGKTSLPNFAAAKFRYNWADFVQQQYDAIGAEAAVGLYTNNPIQDYENRNGLVEADVGVNIEVKHTHYARGHLIIPLDANDNEIAVLVTGALPTYHLMGWIPVKMAKQVRYLHSSKSGYWISQDNLFEMSTLATSKYGAAREVHP